jgi:creatinine amidohydrolase
MRPYILAESHWGTVQKEKYQLAVLPWGATEAHNYHLPYGTDNFETEALVHEAARLAWESGARVVVLPCIPVGVNTGQNDIYMTLSINPGTQLVILEDLVGCLSGHGLNKLLVVNGHGGNDFRQMIREVGSRHREVFVATCNWYQSVDKDAFFERGGDHADEMETSLMLHTWPELVLPLSTAGRGKSKKFRVEGLNEPWAWTERKWSRVTDDTGIGDPGSATSEKGERYFVAVTRKLAALMTGIATTAPEDLYTV